MLESPLNQIMYGMLPWPPNSPSRGFSLSLCLLVALLEALMVPPVAAVAFVRPLLRMMIGRYTSMVTAQLPNTPYADQLGWLF